MGRGDSSSIPRRNVLQAIGAVGAVSMAGCISGNGDDDGVGDREGPADDAERIPVLELSYMGNAPRTAELEAGIDVLVENMEDLGLSVETNPMDGLTYVQSGREDERHYDVTYMYGNPTLDRLDPMLQVERQHILTSGPAGVTGDNYSSCEASAAIDSAAQSATEEELQERVTEVLNLLADDFVQCATTNIAEVGAVRTDEINPAEPGLLGYSRSNPLLYIRSEVTNDDNVIIGDFEREGVSSLREIVSSNGLDTLAMFNHLVNSPLQTYDPETLEPMNLLAESIDISGEDDSWSVTVTLKEGLTFTNDEPITAEDVEFTFEMARDMELLFPQSRVDFADSEVLDDLTVRFDFDAPNLTFTLGDTVQWGILHRETWEPAYDNPEEFEPEAGDLVGSGPFEISSFERDESLTLTPRDNDNYPLSIPDHEIIFVPFTDEQTKISAFESGEVNLITSIRPTLIEGLEENMGDDVETAALDGWSGYYFRAEHAEAPGKFGAFREALWKIPDRRLINEVTNDGRAEVVLEAGVADMLPTHPFYPEEGLPEYTDQPDGDIEAAADVLEDAGYTWDDDGRLYYPPDADLDPLFPGGEMPDPSEFECLDDDSGEYIGDAPPGGFRG